MTPFAYTASPKTMVARSACDWSVRTAWARRVPPAWALRYDRADDGVERPPTIRPSMVSEDSVLEFLRLFWAIDHQLQRASKRMMRDLGVTGPQRLAIRMLARMPGASPQAVAAALHLHKSTVTGILQRLERQGVLSRIVDPLRPAAGPVAIDRERPSHQCVHWTDHRACRPADAVPNAPANPQRPGRRPDGGRGRVEPELSGQGRSSVGPAQPGNLPAQRARSWRMRG